MAAQYHAQVPGLVRVVADRRCSQCNKLLSANPPRVVEIECPAPRQIWDIVLAEILRVDAVAIQLPQASEEGRVLSGGHDVLRSYGVDVAYYDVHVPSGTGPELNAAATSARFRSLARRCRDASGTQQALVLGRLFAAVQDNQAVLRQLYGNAQTTDEYVGDLIRPMKVNVGGNVIDWFAEDVPGVVDQWVQTTTETVSTVLIPTMIAWTRASQALALAPLRCKGCVLC